MSAEDELRNQIKISSVFCLFTNAALSSGLFVSDMFTHVGNTLYCLGEGCCLRVYRLLTL